MREKWVSTLAIKNVLFGVKKEHLQKCSHCFVGKQNRVSFKSHIPSRKLEIGDLVHFENNNDYMMTNKLPRKRMKHVALLSDF